MAIVRVTSKGQATLPKELRDKLGIKAPGRVSIREEGGRLVVEPVLSLAELAAKYRPFFQGGPSIAEMREEEKRIERAREGTLPRRRRR